MRPGAGMADAFGRWLEQVLGDRGLVVYNAADPASKPLAAQLFSRELATPGQTARLAGAAGADLTTRGYHSQVQLQDDSLALFHLDGSRRPIRQQNGQFVVGDEAYAPDLLVKRAADQPAGFSPNVLLRPVVQDAIFPTICYVAGPSELAYLGQLRGVYEHFGVPMPLMYPRASATLVDSAAFRFLTKYGVPLEALQAQDEAALNELLKSQIPAEIEASLAEASTAIDTAMARVIGAMPLLDPTLEGAARSTAGPDAARPPDAPGQDGSGGEAPERHAAAPIRARPRTRLSPRPPPGTYDRIRFVPEPVRPGARRTIGGRTAPGSRPALDRGNMIEIRRTVKGDHASEFALPAWWRLKWVRLTAIGLAIPAVLFFFALGYYYVSFARLLDARLRGERSTVLPRVHARPLELRRGQSLTERQLVDRLNDLGYAQRTMFEKPGEFVIGSGDVTIMPRGAEFKGQSVRVVFRRPTPPNDESSQRRPAKPAPPPAADRVLALERGTRPAERVTLDAPVLTALINGEREKRRPVALSAIPSRMTEAVLAIEDRRYYQHPGVDPIWQSPGRSSPTRPDGGPCSPAPAPSPSRSFATCSCRSSKG